MVREQFDINPYSEEFMEVDFKYLDKMIRNLNILHDIDPNFKLIDHTDEK